MTRFRCHTIVFIGCALLLCPLVLAQSDTERQDDDVVAAARRAREAKASRAKVVLTDDDVEAKKGPIPELNFEGPSNTSAILTSFKEYRATHTPAETEAALRSWYEGCESRFSGLLQDVRNLAEIVSRRPIVAQMTSAEHEPAEEEPSAAELHALEQDRRRVVDQMETLRRVRNDLSMIEKSLKAMSVRYDWFTIPQVKVGSYVEK